jgi:hypothetical protein
VVYLRPSIRASPKPFCTGRYYTHHSVHYAGLGVYIVIHSSKGVLVARDGNIQSEITLWASALTVCESQLCALMDERMNKRVAAVVAAITVTTSLPTTVKQICTAYAKRSTTGVT